MSNLRCETVWKLLRIYDFDFEIKIPDDLICVICRKILVNAHQSPCSCKFCLECISSYLNDVEKFCPGQMEDCKEQKMNFKRDIQVDYITNRKISMLKVKCPYSDCSNLIELKILNEHLKTHIVTCPYSEIGCNTSESLLININQHLINENFVHTKLLLKCIIDLKNEINDVKNGFVLIKENLQTNDIITNNFQKIVNLFHENKTIKSEETAMNIELEQSLTENLKPNDYFQSNYKSKMISENVVKNENVFIQFDEDKSYGDDNESVSLKKELDLFKTEHQKLFEDIESKKHEIKIINEKLLMKQKSILKLEMRLETLKRKSEFVENQELMKWESNNKIDSKLDKKKEVFQNMLKKLLQDLKEPRTPNEINKIFMNMFESYADEDAFEFLKRSSFLEENSYKDILAPYDWKIDNFSNKWKLAREGIDPYIMSSDFYSHKNGYKLILGIYPDGFDTEQGTYLSVFFHIAKGDHDHNLPWPMKNEISISLINQETDLPHSTETFKYESAEISFLPSYYRPKTAINLGYGDTQFINLLTLFNNDTILKNDCIILRCSVERL